MSKQQRKIRARRRRHAQVTRRVCTTGGLAVAATLLTGTVANAATISVTTTADSGPGSLRAAITTANGTTAADTINFASTLSGPIDLASALPTITEPLTITGSGRKTVISGQNNVGVFSVSSGAGATEIDNLVVEDGKAVNGGGIDVTGTGSPLTLKSDYLTGNHSTGTSGSDGGGAIYSDSALTMSGSALAFNVSAGDGGAIDSVAGAASVANATLYDNTALKGGAVAALSPAGSTITGATIVKNAATGTGNRGGGIYAASGDQATINDSIVSGNTATTGSDVSIATGGTAPTTAFSLFGTLSGSGITTAPSSDIVGTNPDLNEFLSSTLTMTPMLGSPVIDRGKAFGLTTDQRGDTRPYDLIPANAPGGDGSDIGAVEVQRSDVAPVVTSQSAYSGPAGTTITLTGSKFTGVDSVTFGSTQASFQVISDTQMTVTVPAGSGSEPVTLANVDAGTSIPAWSYPGETFTVTSTADSGPGSLRDAITQANTDGGVDEITFASGLTGTITLASSLPEIRYPVTIDGPGAADLTVNGAGKYDLFYLDSPGSNAISGLTVTDSVGSGIASNGSVTLDGDTVTDNDAAANAFGGAVYAETLTVDDSTLSGNHAFVGGAFAVEGSATVTDSTISGNTANYAGGGDAGQLSMIGSTVSGNTASDYAGGVVATSATIIGSTILGDTYPAVYTDSASGTLTLEDSVVSGSTGAQTDDVYARGGGTASFSLIGVNGENGSYGVTTDSTDIIGKDPMLGPLQNNGGPTATMLPLPGSPLLDAGKAFGVSTDQRGLNRTVDLPGIANALGGDATDIGAVETELPTVTAVNPATGAAAATVTVSGAGFTGATQLLFGSTPATSFTVTNDEQITATVPAGSGTVDVHVVGPYGQSATASADQFSYPAPPTTTTTSTPPPTTTTTTTTTTTPTPTPKPATSTHKATFDNQQLVLTLPAASACTKAPATVTLTTTAIKKSKAQKLTFVKAAIYVDKGVKHVRKVKVHGKTRTVTTYTPNVTVHKASSTSKLTGTKGKHSLKTVITYRQRVTRNHKTRTVTVTKTLTGTLNLC